MPQVQTVVMFLNKQHACFLGQWCCSIFDSNMHLFTRVFLQPCVTKGKEYIYVYIYMFMCALHHACTVCKKAVNIILDTCKLHLIDIEP